MKTLPLAAAAIFLAAGWLPHATAQAESEDGQRRPATLRLPPLPAIDGREVQAPDPDAKITVVALTSVTCPLSQKYGPTLAELEKHYTPQSVRFVFLNPMSTEPAGEMARFVNRLQLKSPYVQDPGSQWAKALGAKTTTETFVLSPQGEILYRGAVDDQYAVGASLPEPRTRFLAEALDALLQGRRVPRAETPAPGCLLNTPTVAVAEQAPTYHGHVQRIIQNNCLSCHRPDGVAPFALETYESVRSRARMLQFVVDTGVMPPWFAAPGSGPWKNDISLPDEDKAALRAWVEAGMPQGDPAQAPTPPTFTTSKSNPWTIGPPHAVFQLPEPVQIKATGVMPYVNINVPTNFTEDKWVEKIEVIPGDRRAVHHVLVFVRAPETASQSRLQGLLDPDTRDELSGFFGIYVPGNSALVYPQGLAKRVPKGAVLRFQLHYTPYGQPTTDQTKIGLSFAEKPPVNEVHTASLANLRFAIPPGATNHQVDAQVRVPTDVKILSFLPHMHVRGKAARYELTAEGETRVLLDIPRYDFNWQLNYVLQDPLPVSAGDTLTFRAWYDNSDDNPDNPDPTATVRWGAQTFDEMHLGYIEYIVPGQTPGQAPRQTQRLTPSQDPAQPQGRLGIAGNIESTFRRLDRDQDGFVTEAEAPLLWNRIKDADTNRDRKISLEEAINHFRAADGG